MLRVKQIDLPPGSKIKGEEMNYQFDFERLDAYMVSLNFTNQVFSITSKYSREIQYSLGDQFRRAALSICNNLAEGSRKSSRSRKQFYEYSFDSARECIPMISLSVLQNQISAQEGQHLRSECIRICNMLYRLSSSVQTS